MLKYSMLYINCAYVPANVAAALVEQSYVPQYRYLLANRNLEDVPSKDSAIVNLGINPDEAIWNAGSIAGTEVDNTDIADEKVLSYDSDSEKIVWATGGTSRGSTNITSANSGETLSTEFDYFFVHVNFGSSYSVDLPAVEDMVGRELTFVNVNNNFESWFSVNGPIGSSGSLYTLSGYATVKLLSDGTHWWITGTHTNS